MQQKVTLEKVNGLCLKLEDADEFKHCTSTLKHYRKSYRVMLQALLEKRDNVPTANHT